MTLVRWVPIAAVTLLLLGTGCANAAPPTCVPAGYSYFDYPANEIPASSQIRLTRVIWGPYLIRFLGTTNLGKEVRLQALLYKNGQPVDWWPDHQWVQIRGGTWETGINANYFDIPAEFPRLESGYSLGVFESDYAAISAKFELDITGLPSQATPADNITAADLDGSQWVLSSINGHSPLLFTHITLSFRGGGAGGSGGCNSYGSKYQTKAPNLINISSLISTQVGCWWKAITNQEEAYLKSLRDAVCYRIVGNRLELYDVLTNKRSLVFERQAESQ